MKQLCAGCYYLACVKAGVPDGGLEVYATRPLTPNCDTCASKESRYLVRDDVAALALSETPFQRTLP